MSKQKLSAEFRSTSKEIKNIIATDKVWCLNCSSYHPINGIDSHLRLHCAVSTKSVGSFVKQRPLQPIDINIELPTHPFVKDFEMDIMTMNAECLPQADTERKKIAKPKPRGIQPDSNRVPQVFFPVPSDVFEQAPTEPSELKMHLEQFMTDEYYQQISLQKMYVKVAEPGTNRITLTDTARQRGQFDKHVQKAKQPPPQKLNPDMNKYKIELPTTNHQRSLYGQTKVIAFVDDAKVIPGGQITTRITSRATSRNPIRKPSVVHRNNIVNENSSPRRYGLNLTNLISTCAGVDVAKDNADSQITAPYTTYNRMNSRMEANMSCPGCGGFYCSVCKSTVPPQFRPVPTEHSCCPSNNWH